MKPSLLRGHAGAIPWCLLDDCINLGLDQPFRIDESRHLHDRAYRPNVAEEFPVDLGHGAPILNPSQEDARADDVAQPSAKLLQRSFRYLKASAGLRSSIAGADSLSIRS